MTRLSIHQPCSFIGVYAVLPFLLVSLVDVLPLADVQLRQLVLPGVLGSILVLFAWVELVRGRRLVTIDTDCGLVEVHSVSALFSSKKRTLPLAQFASVVSYLVPGKSASRENRLELVTAKGGQALMLASYTPGRGKVRRWFFPSEGEAPEARRLRQIIASECGVRDAGFLGVRMVGAQV